MAKIKNFILIVKCTETNEICSIFFQKLYRFINTVDLVSPHHSIKEIVANLREGQIASLFQKSVKKVSAIPKSREWMQTAWNACSSPLCFNTLLAAYCETDLTSVPVYFWKIYQIWI